MDRDIFDKEIGAQLRRAEAPVPEGAWEAISSEISGGAGSSGFGFIGAAAAGAVMLGSLAVYSTFFTPGAEAIAEDLTAKTEQVAPASESAQDSDYEVNVNSDTEPDQSIAPVSENSEGVSSSERYTSRIRSEAEEERVDAGHAEDRSSATTDKSEENNLTSPPISPEVFIPESIPASGVTPPAASGADRKAVAPATAPAEPLRASIRAENLKGYAPFEIDFEAFGNFEEVNWDFGPYGQSAQVNTRRTFDKPGTYTVMLTAYGEGGAVITDMVTIEVREGSNLVVPDSFTPNGDGINDTFKAEGVNMASYQLTVTDARGNVVFETRNIDEPWVFNGTPGSEMEAYFAIIRAEGVDGKTYKVRQRINIIY